MQISRSSGATTVTDPRPFRCAKSNVETRKQTSDSACRPPTARVRLPSPIGGDPGRPTRTGSGWETDDPGTEGSRPARKSQVALTGVTVWPSRLRVAAFRREGLRSSERAAGLARDRGSRSGRRASAWRSNRQPPSGDGFGRSCEARRPAASAAGRQTVQRRASARSWTGWKPLRWRTPGRPSQGGTPQGGPDSQGTGTLREPREGGGASVLRLPRGFSRAARSFQLAASSQ